MKTKLSVIIATYNRDKSLEKCLTSLAKQSYKNFEVVIVDGGSKDKTNEVIEKFSKRLNICKLVYKYPQLAEVRDFGWKNSKGEILAWIDDDVVLSPNWAKGAMNIFFENKKVGGITGPTVIPKRLRKKRDVFSLVNQNSLLAKIWKNYFCEGKWSEVGKLFKSGAWGQGSNFPESLDIKGLKKVDYLEACNMFLRRNLVEKVGGYDLSYRGTSEWCELDLAIRVKNLAYKLVFSSKVSCEHHVSSSGVFEKRVNARVRMENFLFFYFRHIFQFNLNYIIRFVSYVIFLDLFWIYKFFKTGNYRWLGGIWGNISGIWKIVENS